MSVEVSILDRALRILHLEDNLHDRELVQQTLHSEGFAIEITNACTRGEFGRALREQPFDIILSDKSLPAFDGLEALDLAKKLHPEIPFIFVTGSMGEETAIDTIKFGATDYVLKDRLQRLRVAIERAIREADRSEQNRMSTEALRQSEERFQLIARASNDVIWDWNIETGHYWQSHGIRRFGYSDAIAPGPHPWLDHIPAEHRARVRAGIQKVLDSNQPYWSDEYPFMRQDGTLAHVFNRAYVVRRPDGRALRLMGAMMDVTQRKLAEQLALERTRLATLRAEITTALSGGADFKHALQQACDCVARDLDIALARIWTLEEKAGLLVLQTGSGPLAGISGFQAMLPVGDSLIGQIALQHKAQWTNAFADDSAGEDRELARREHLSAFAGRPLLAGGQLAGVLAIYSKNPLNDFHTECLAVAAHEIAQGIERQRAQEKIEAQEAERQKLEARFLRAQRLESIGALASGIAHDLNNVLAPILIGVRFLKEQSQDATTLKILGAMESSAVRGAGIVQQVLTFGRGASDEKTVLQPNLLIHEMVKFMGETFPKSIQIRTRCEPALWDMEGDPTQIHQVLLNLCINARDAMPRGGTLTLVSQNTTLKGAVSCAGLSAGPGDFVQIQIVDSGTGMSAEIQKSIFQPFFTTKGPGKGTGLGLSTTVSILRSHAGVLSLESEPGRGTTFSLFFPAKVNRRAAVAAKVAPALPAGKHELILLVDDEVAIREMSKVILESFDYRVLTAENGAEALSLLARHKEEIAAVIMDMMMPVLDGPAAIRAMRWSAPQLKIIATSGSGLAEKDQSAGPDDPAPDCFLAKPYAADQLVGTLGKLLGKT
ncbi:MAG: response regulator [Verrucomicrobiota bacterium]|jgi:PAS domain S-box-containing protein